MASIWGGVFIPISKHRDFEHDSFFEHQLEAGAILGFKIDEAEDIAEDYVDLEEFEDIEEAIQDIEEARELLDYWVPKLKTYTLRRNPVSGLELENRELYYVLGIVLSGKKYDYLIPGRLGELPTRKVIEETLQLYIETYVEDGRDVEDYI